MRKIKFTILSFAFIAVSFSSMAQRIELMALAGLNGSIIKQKDFDEGFERLYSGHGGILAGIGTEGLLFETGLIFSARGARLVPVPGSGSGDPLRLSLNYLEIPFMAVVAPQNFRLFIGPQLSMLMSAKQEKTSGSVKDAFEKSNWELRYGAGYNRDRVTLQLYFLRGFTDINKDPSVKWKTQSIQLSIGYLLFNYQGAAGKRKTKDNLIPEHRVID